MDANPAGQNTAAPKLIVGIGASAGGIEACKALFSAVPADSGIAFILVLHLDPTRASHIAEILQAQTPNVTITQAEGTARLAANHAYVIAPSSKLQLADGVLEVDPLAENEKRGRLVDYLFASLAEAERSRSVGVVLSGAGYDGTEGLRRIKAAGGLAIAQNPSTAATTSMPQSAIEADAVNAVLPPDAIPSALLEFAEHGTRPVQQEDGTEGEDQEDNATPPSGFERILAQLGERAEADFSDYKSGTLERRARRRMNLKRIDDWDEYGAFLASHPEELEALYHDVLIGVTEFFRDPEVWSRLAAELPALLEQRDAPGIRVWVPGCGTGEEAYTIAMLAFETVPAKARSKIQIYAMDLNENALAIARRGQYPPNALAFVDQARRERYFHQRDGQLRIDRAIRDCVTFAPHNVLSDAPLSKMDLVSCRNLLIYLRPQAHERLLKRLHFALRPGGLLLLGRAETLGRQSALFEEVSRRHSLFRARSVPRQQRLPIQSRTREKARVPAGHEPSAAPSAAQRRRDAGPERRIEQFVLRERTLASVVINTHFEIRHFYGPTQQYLVPPPGESRQDLLAWVRPGFYIRLRSALKQVIERGDALTTEGHVNRDGEVLRVECTVEPLPEAITAEPLFLVSFRDVGRSPSTSLPAAEAQEPLVRELEQDLTDTRRELQSVMDQLESAGEEYNASNEELQSLNEELQSSNEELEASKEELEALNEEMNTINSELEEKNSELREANADLNNLFLSTGIPIVFLDRELRIRRFTTAATRAMRLVPSDVGRSIEHVKERYGEGQTHERSRKVLETLEPDTREIATEDGRCYMRNIVPYRLDGDVEGVCITFTDVTEQKRATQASEAARAYSDAIIETVRTPVLALDGALRIVSMNHAFRAMFDASSTLVGRRVPAAHEPQWKAPRLGPVLDRLLREGRDIDGCEAESGDRAILINARRIAGEAGTEDADRLVLSFEDVTEQRNAHSRSEERAAELLQDAHRKDQWIAMLGHELRNPVGAIGNGIELLKSLELEPAERARTVTMVQRQVDHVADLLDNLLDAARIVSGKLRIEREPVDLSEIGEWALDTVSKTIQEKQHRLEATLPPPGSVRVSGDALRLTEVVSNLLTNAAKYTEPSGKIALEITADADTAVIRVSDTGIGIASGFEDDIFEIFTQGPRTLDRADRGLGLGLPLVRTLVKLHGGEVKVFSAGEDQGTEFKVLLPRLSHAQPEAAAAGREAASAPAPHQRILIVDDEHDIVESLELLLQQQWGMETRRALDAAEALEAARELEPTVALLDLGLPGMDGYELARRLRDAFPGILLIAVTGYQKDLGRLRDAGFDHHLMKPIDMRRLSSLLGPERVEPPPVQ